MTICEFMEKDWGDVWQVIKPVFRAGETYAFSCDITEEDAYKTWIVTPAQTYVVRDADNTLLGTYYIKPNQAGPGAHVCNCGYIVSDKARGKGVASKMCAHSQEEAVAKGFRAMQFNHVVSTNEGAVRLWKKHGFEIVGTLPGAFHHPKEGYVDAYVMFKTFVSGT